MLAFLGWNPGTEQEIFSIPELAELFSLERVGKSGSKFDPEKARWFNHKYLVEKPVEDLTAAYLIFLKSKGITSDTDFVEKIVRLVKDRAHFVRDFWEQSSFFFMAPEKFDVDTVKKRWKPDTPPIMEDLSQSLKQISDFKAEDIKANIVKFTEEKSIGLGIIMNTLRLVLVGGAFGPDLMQIAELLGKDEVISRIKYGIRNIPMQ
jgi:glutamyl-tRNA synthetase